MLQKEVEVICVHSCFTHIPVASSSKQAKAFLMTSSGSVPFNFSPNMVRNMVKLMGPGASFIMASRYSSVGFFPTNKGIHTCFSFQTEEVMPEVFIQTETPLISQTQYFDFGSTNLPGKHEQQRDITKGGEHVVQVLFVNEAIPVLVDHVEGLLEFLDLRLIKHGKYIGSGALRALLGGLCLCPFARHGGCWF